ncbi:glycosyltransferase family A protein [Oscillatoria sp. HE19RPO]|uniref:glycosyltransferase family 2 protein n=1 Tax=Oscillatoria sp. HE19RPO TaxID=2954806 RepID=UPI0020C5403C|nr:glycosyltransferase family A protein [Oscillatoria sp. HE19RPO]
MSPTISIVIPAYNAAATILQTLDSVFQQTFSDFEVLVINDGSTDQTLDLLQTIEDKRLQIFTYENRGVSVARNRGISYARGEFIAFLDADDLWSPDKLELQFAALQEHPEAGVAYSWNYYQYETPAKSYAETSNSFQGNVYADLLIKNFIQNGSNPLVRKEAVASVGLFDPTLKSCQDWDYYLRLAQNWPFVLVPKVQVIYRQSANSATSNIEVMEYYLLLLINRTFESVPQELKPLKNQSLSWVYQYIAEHYLKSQKATLKQLSGVGIKLCKTIYLHPPHLLEEYTQSLIRMFLKQLFLRLTNPKSRPQLQKT